MREEKNKQFMPKRYAKPSSVSKYASFPAALPPDLFLIALCIFSKMLARETTMITLLLGSQRLQPTDSWSPITICFQLFTEWLFRISARSARSYPSRDHLLIALVLNVRKGQVGF
jgi:hypothetical protein